MGAIGRGADAAGEESGCNAKPGALADLVTHGVNGERNAALVHLGRRGDRIKPRLQRIERFDERLRIGLDAGKFLQRRQHVEVGRVAVRVFAGGKVLRLLPALAAGDVGKELE